MKGDERKLDATDRPPRCLANFRLVRRIPGTFLSGEDGCPSFQPEFEGLGRSQRIPGISCGDTPRSRLGDGVEDATCMRMVVDIGRRAECTREIARLEAEKSVDYERRSEGRKKRRHRVRPAPRPRWRIAANLNPTGSNWLAARDTTALRCSSSLVHCLFWGS